MGITNVIQTNEIIKNYYEVLSNIRSELINRIKEIIKEDVEIYDTSEEIDDEYYELPTKQEEAFILSYIKNFYNFYF